jgi:transcriptional regulator with XRE-family HTH domain
VITRQEIIDRIAALDISQADLARRAGYHPVSLNQYLKGGREIDTATLGRIVDALGGVAWKWKKARKVAAP